MSKDREALIRERAYRIWVEQGRPDGRDEANWHEATQQIDREQQTGAEMVQENADETIGRPKQGSVVPDTRPAEEPENRTDEPPPVHAEKPAAKGKRGAAKATAASKTTGSVEKKPGKVEKAAASAHAGTPAAKPRKGKAKSASMETL